MTFYTKSNSTVCGNLLLSPKLSQSIEIPVNIIKLFSIKCFQLSVVAF